MGSCPWVLIEIGDRSIGQRIAPHSLAAPPTPGLCLGAELWQSDSAIQSMFAVLAPALLLTFSAVVPPSDVLLRVRLASMEKAKLATWLNRRGFAAVLPIQPMVRMSE